MNGRVREDYNPFEETTVKQGSAEYVVHKLRTYKDDSGYRYADFFCGYLAWYLESRHAAGEMPLYADDIVYRHLVYYIADAIACLRTSNDFTIAEYRTLYARNAFNSHEVPDLESIAYTGPERVITIVELARMLTEVTEHAPLRKDVEGFFFAQDRVLEQYARAFLRHVYRRGLYAMLHASVHAGFSGQFKQTTLRSFESAGRMLFTFARASERFESSVTLISDGSDAMGIRTGIQSVHADLSTACAMITDVVEAWPASVSMQEKMYQPDKKISIG